MDPRLLILFGSGILPGVPGQSGQQDSRKASSLTEARKAMATGLLLERQPLHAAANVVLALAVKDPQDRLHVASAILYGIVCGADAARVLRDRGELELVLRAAETMFPFCPATGAATISHLVASLGPEAFHDMAIFRTAMLCGVARMIAAVPALKDPFGVPVIQIHSQLCKVSHALHQTMWPFDTILSVNTSSSLPTDQSNSQDGTVYKLL